VEVPKDISQQEAEACARSQPSVLKFLEGMPVKKVVFVPGRILNFIVAGQK
jgi:leucyl-tRNA synthetase